MLRPFPKLGHLYGMAGFADVEIPIGLAQRVVRGEEAAYAQIYQLLSPAVMSLGYRMLGNRPAAEEVVQDVFVQLLEHAHTLKQPAALVGWVRTTATNHCLMRLRSPWQKRRSAEEPQEGADAGEDAERVHGLSDVERALEQLPEQTRMVVWLHDVEGYTHKEIGALMGKTASFSKSQLARGYGALMKRLRGRDEYETDDQRTACTS